MIFPHSLSALLWLLYCGCIGYELPAMIRAVRHIRNLSTMRELLAGFPSWVGQLVLLYTVVCVAPLLPLHTVQRLWAWVRRVSIDQHLFATPVAGEAFGLAPVQMVASVAEGDTAVYEAFEMDPTVIYDPYLSLKSWIGAYIESGGNWVPGGYLVRGMGVAAVPTYYTADEFAAQFELVTFTNPPHPPHLPYDLLSD